MPTLKGDIKIIKKFIICDVCNKPIEELIEIQSEYEALYTYIAKCHGATEKVSLSLEDTICNKIEAGRAFQTKRLNETKRITCNDKDTQ